MSSRTKTKEVLRLSRLTAEGISGQVHAIEMPWDVRCGLRLGSCEVCTAWLVHGPVDNQQPCPCMHRAEPEPLCDPSTEQDNSHGWWEVSEAAEDAPGVIKVGVMTGRQQRLWVHGRGCEDTPGWAVGWGGIPLPSLSSALDSAQQDLCHNICSYCGIKEMVKKVKQAHSPKYMIARLKWPVKGFVFDHTCS